MEDQDTLRMIESAVHYFVLKEVMPVGYARELEGKFPHDVLHKVYANGFGGMSIPEEYGGGGASTVATCIVARELAYGWPSLHLVWSANNSLVGFPLAEFGTEEQKRLYLPPLARGEMYGCYALTEANAGSDAASLTTRAEKKDGAWILNGTKMFITNASEATFAVIFARIPKLAKSSSKRHAGITAFLLHAHGPGLQYPGVEVREIEKRGLKCSPLCEIRLTDVQIPYQNILGGEDAVGKGFSFAMHTLNNGRINIAAQAVGIARRAFDVARVHAKMRNQFDRPLFANQVVAHTFAELETRIDAAWELTLKAARLNDEKIGHVDEAAKAKLFASEVAVDAALEAYRVHGAMGFCKETIVMDILHDALATITYEGASNIQREIIARYI